MATDFMEKPVRFRTNIYYFLVLTTLLACGYQDNGRILTVHTPFETPGLKKEMGKLYHTDTLFSGWLEKTKTINIL